MRPGARAGRDRGVCGSGTGAVIDTGDACADFWTPPEELGSARGADGLRSADFDEVSRAGGRGLFDIDMDGAAGLNESRRGVAAEDTKTKVALRGPGKSQTRGGPYGAPRHIAIWVESPASVSAGARMPFPSASK